MKENLPWWWAGTCRNTMVDSHIVMTLAGALSLSAVLRGTDDSRLELLKFDPRMAQMAEYGSQVGPVWPW